MLAASPWRTRVTPARCAVARAGRWRRANSVVCRGEGFSQCYTGRVSLLGGATPLSACCCEGFMPLRRGEEGGRGEVCLSESSSSHRLRRRPVELEQTPHWGKIEPTGLPRGGQLTLPAEALRQRLQQNTGQCSFPTSQGNGRQSRHSWRPSCHATQLWGDRRPPYEERRLRKRLTNPIRCGEARLVSYDKRGVELAFTCWPNLRRARSF